MYHWFTLIENEVAYLGMFDDYDAAQLAAPGQSVLHIGQLRNLIDTGMCALDEAYRVFAESNR